MRPNEAVLSSSTWGPRNPIANWPGPTIASSFAARSSCCWPAWLPLDKSGRWTVWSSWPQPNLAIYQPAAVGFYFSQNGKIGSFVIGFDRWRPDLVANWPDRVIHSPWLLKPIRAKGQPPALWLEVHNESVVYWLGKRQRVQCLCIRLVRKCTCWVWGYGVELVLAN